MIAHSERGFNDTTIEGMHGYKKTPHASSQLHTESIAIICFIVNVKQIDSDATPLCVT